MEKAGDAGFRHRLATIITDLHHDRSAALDAIRSEVFGSQLRNRTGMSGAAAVAAFATLNAFDRLASLQPELGIAGAREKGFRAAVNTDQDQRRILWSIASRSDLPPEEKRRRMADAGLFDMALAEGVMGAIGPAYRGGLLGPADRPGAIPVGPKADARIGRLDQEKALGPADKPGGGAQEPPPEVPRPPEPTVGRTELEALRRRIMVWTRHTLGVAKTNVPGLENETFEGASSLVREEANLPRPAPGPIKSNAKNPRDADHAEEVIANRFVESVERRGLTPSDLDGYTLAIHISNPNGVCTTCRRGLGTKAEAGVLKQLSERYPGLNIRVTVETEPNVKPSGPTDFTIRNGNYIRRNDR
jgi:hypothetical protein